jgi:hypothetical protein
MSVHFPTRATRVRRELVARSAIALTAALVVAAACSDDSTAPRALPEVQGSAVAVGNGTARTFVVPSSSGQPLSIGIELTASALDSLPSSTTEWVLPFPAGMNVAPWDHATLDWNPQGHPPMEIYGVPHFDFHFYTITTAEQMAIAGGPDTTTVPAADVPVGYASQVMAVPMMGVHWTDTTAAEYHGQPFDKTFIYGFYHGREAFVEPMVTKTLLESHPDVSAPVKQPQTFQLAGFYPRSYSVRYDASSQVIRVTLDSLTSRTGS